METGEKVIIALVVVVFIGAIGGVAVVMPTMMEEMEKPENCGKNCHEMQPFYDSLEESVHKGVDCHDCHKPHEPEILEKVMLMGHALHHAAGMIEGKSFEEMAEEIEEKAPASPKNEVCEECHKEGGEAKIASEKILDPSISCFKCHSTIAHRAHRVGEYRAYESPDYSGYECAACHNDHDIDVKEETCNACHPPEKHP